MMKDDSGIRGQATLRLYGPDGELKHEETIHNLITTSGDEYYAEKGVDGVASFAKSKANATGMKLGNSDTTGVAKSSTGAVLGGYITGSNATFDANASSVSAVGTDTGYKIRYTCQWAAGVATDTNIVNAIICNDAATDANSSEANTYARVIFSAINKGASDTLVINWDHTLFDSAS